MDNSQYPVDKTILLVEANSFEVLCLWQKHFEKNPAYKQHHGCLVTVGHIDERPICVSLMWSRLGDKYICFYEATSALVDWVLIEEYLDQTFPNVRRVDAGNFVVPRVND